MPGELKLKAKIKKYALSIIFLLIIFAVILFFTLPVFKVSEIKCNDLLFIDKSEVIAATGIKKGDNILKNMSNPLLLRYHKPEKRVLNQINILGDVRIKLDFPSTVVIEAEERVPAAYIEYEGSYIFLGIDRCVMRISSKPPINWPEMRGIKLLQAEVGQKPVVESEPELMRCIRLLEAVISADLESREYPPLYPMIKSIKPLSVNRVMLEIPDPRKGAMLEVICTNGDSTTSDLIWLKTVLATGELEDYFPGAFDFTGKQIIFRSDKRKEIEEESEESLADDLTVEEQYQEPFQEPYQEAEQVPEQDPYQEFNPEPYREPEQVPEAEPYQEPLPEADNN